MDEELIKECSILYSLPTVFIRRVEGGYLLEDEYQVASRSALLDKEKLLGLAGELIKLANTLDA